VHNFTNPKFFFFILSELPHYVPVVFRHSEWWELLVHCYHSAKLKLYQQQKENTIEFLLLNIGSALIVTRIFS